MKLRSISSALVLAWGGLTGGAEAQQPPRLFQPVANNIAAVPNQNQLLADNVAAQLRSTGTADGADVNILAFGGSVELSGTVRDPQQRARIEKVVAKVPGVNGGVRNNLVVMQDEVPNTLPPVGGAPLQSGQPIPGIPIEGGAPSGGMIQGGPISGGPISGGPISGGPIYGGNSDPAPLAPPMQGQYDMNAPKLPPYAWPTYAPYNNFSRVAYPETYPYNAWPYIGPFYPFPKVPLGWRKVTLEWEDGHWYYGRVATPHDYWRVRYW